MELRCDIHNHPLTHMTAHGQMVMVKCEKCEEEITGYVSRAADKEEEADMEFLDMKEERDALQKKVDDILGALANLK